MSSLKEIVENEGQRDSLDKCRTAFLYREGSFYRAYEWSAWLFVRHVSDFKVTCRVFKAVEQAVAFIGFPLTSAGKFMPDGFTAKPLSVLNSLNSRYILSAIAIICFGLFSSPLLLLSTLYRTLPTASASIAAVR